MKVYLIIESFYLETIIIKPTNLIGPGHSNGVCSILARKVVEMKQNKSNKILEVNNLLAQRDFLDVRDAVKAYEILFKKGESGNTYEIASGKSYSLKEIVAYLKFISKVDFHVISIIDQLEEKIYVCRSRMLELGWRPFISLEYSLKEIINFYRADK